MYIWALTMCTVFRIIMNLCKIMRDTEDCTITQTIHTNRISCSVTQAKGVKCSMRDADDR